MEQYAKIQQILKKEEGQKERKPIYPPTVIQAVFDAKTGASLEAILAQFNSIYVQYQGTPQDTRCIIPEKMRRAGLTITYMNMDSETITERAASAVQKDNDHWGLDINWSRVDELSLSGDISVSAQGTWIINGEDTGIKALGPKGDAGLTPWLKTIDNRLHFSYDNVNWEPCSEPIAAYFRFNATSGNTQSGTIGKIQISRDNKTWNDLSPEFTNNLHIAGYVAATSALPANKPVGTIYGVGPTYAAEDTAHTNPIYRIYVYNGTTWVDNGQFTSIAAGIVQETGDSETEVMSQKATTEKLKELASEVDNIKITPKSYQLTEINNTVLRGDVIGTTIVDGFSTSDYISIEGVSKIVYKNTFAVQPNNFYTGFVMYNDNKDEIVYVGGDSGEVVLSDYPNAKYFRYCVSNETNLEYCKVEVTFFSNDNDLTHIDKSIFVKTISDNIDDYIKCNEHVYVGYGNVFDQNGLLDEFRISLHNASDNDLNSEFEFYIGHIDQRNWLLPRFSFSKAVDKVEGNTLVFDFNDELISYKKNEVIFIKAKKTSLGQSDDNVVPLHSGNNNILYTDNLINALQSYGDKLEASILIKIKNIDSYFASKEEVEIIEDNVNRIDSTISNKQDSILIDESNGNKYKIIVNNGVLAVKLLKYARVLFIGNSFTRHDFVSGLWESNGRSMAATTDSVMYANLVAEKMDIHADRTGLSDNDGLFERLLLDYDLNNLPNKAESYDAIVIQLGENIIETDTNIISSAFRNLFDAIKTNWGNADLYMMFGTWRSQSQTIANVASEMNIPIINCSSVSLSTPYQAKDYYIGDNGLYYEIADNVYRSHPSDVGMYNMAQKIIESFGGSPITNKLFNIELNQSDGGTISIAANKWVEGGVVTIRCTPDSGRAISNIIVKCNGQEIHSTKRIATYTSFTFIMPKGNVEIFPIWS